MQTLQQHLSYEISNGNVEKPYLNELLRCLPAILQSHVSLELLIQYYLN